MTKIAFGFLNLNKPAGFTSHDCVAKVRRILKMKKVGHGGTLDPAATGVLPIALGKGTRLLQFLPETKVYRAKIRLGMTTTTDDLEGEVIKSHPGANVSLEQIESYLPQFVGQIEQLPPIYSAIKRNGKKLYELARKGETVEVSPRIVQIERIAVIDFVSGEFPELELEITCKAGTYIRAIARDLGSLLGVGGTLANLIRTESCGFKLADSIGFEELTAEVERGTFEAIAPSLALAHLSEIVLDSTEATRWCQGQKILCSQADPHNTIVRVRSDRGQFLGIGKITERDLKTLLLPKIVCVQPI